MNIDAELLKNVHDWPATMFGAKYCCLRRPLNLGPTVLMPELGYLLGDAPLKVYLGNIFNRSEKHETIEYDSISALLEDGWIVD